MISLMRTCPETEADKKDEHSNAINKFFMKTNCPQSKPCVWEHYTDNRCSKKPKANSPHKFGGGCAIVF
jgi:hypothetical protein